MPANLSLFSLFLFFSCINGSLFTDDNDDEDDKEESDDDDNNPANDRIQLDCPVEEIYGVTPITIEASTVGKSDDYRVGCSSGDDSGDADLAYRWIAQEEGLYTFSTAGSDFDTVLGIYEENCDLQEIQCNDDSDGSQSELRRNLQAGQAILIIVDGYEQGDRGNVKLKIDKAEERCEDGLDDDEDGLIDCDDPDCANYAPNCLGVTCPEEILPSEIPQEIQATTVDGEESNLGYASCSNDDGNRAPEATFSFTAPATGLYYLDTSGSSFDTLLYVLDETCTGTELACDDDSGTDKTSATQLLLSAGQKIIIVVDGWGTETGNIVLSINGKESQCDNGLDDDNDGLTDCSDPDCVSEECALGSEWSAEWEEIEDQMLSEINARRSEGAYCDTDYYPPVPALESNPYLRLSSRLHSMDMAEQNYFEHTGLDGRSPHERMIAAGFTGDYPTGENISAGYPNSIESMVGLMNSPGHCRNIMSADYKVVGIGFFYLAGSDMERYWTQNFGGSH